MKFLITDYFFKSIPLEKNDKILDRLHFFYNLIKSNNSLSGKLPNGFWIKKINGTNSLYEFRVDSGDRIFFLFNTISRESSEGVIIFLIYSSHDMAIKKAKRKEIFESNLKDFIIFDQEDNIETIDETFFNYNNLITYEILDDSDFISNFHNKKYKYYYLNDEQYSCLVDAPPHFIAGSAGSGKSTITLRKLLNLEEHADFYNFSNILYLTSNRYLKDNSFEQYKEFRKDGEKIADFFTLKEFLSKSLNIPTRNIVDFNRFKEFFRFSYPNRKKFTLSIEEIYSEINGIIKGLMIKDNADNWNRDLSQNIMPLSDYLKLSSKYSTLESEIRKSLYEVCLKYNSWLKENNLYDLNDLSIALTEKKLSFDYIIIDEVQDLTEIEIFALTSLVKSKENLFLAGDIHQMINATFFNFERMKNLFYTKYNQRVNLKILSKNYRSCKKIVDLANYFADLRSTYIGNLGSDDYKEIAIQKDGEVNLTPVNLSLLQKAQESANSAIVVPDDSVKLELLDKLENKHRVFTIQEIKGLEYSNIICYNLSSNYQEKWEKIFAKETKYDQRYRKYFNIFYVGITRAQENLIIMESNIENNNVLKELRSFLTPNNNIIINKKNENLALEKEDWLKEGIKLYKLEQIEEAQYAFEKAGEPTWILEKELEQNILSLDFKNAILKVSLKALKSKEVFYRKLIIDTAIDNNLYFIAAECNRTFGISYKDKEIKEGIKNGISENIFTQKELQKIIQFYKEKKDSNFVGDLLLKMKRFNEALIFYQNLNNPVGIKLARCGILEPYFKSVSNFKEKVDQLDELITNKNINTFDKKEKLTPLHRALLIKKDPILFEMILYLGGNINTYVKGKEFVPFYIMLRMNEPKEIIYNFLDICIKHNFNFNNNNNLYIYVAKVKYFKYLLYKEAINLEIFEDYVNKLLEALLETPDSKIEIRKSTLCKNIIKNYKKEKGEFMNKKQNLLRTSLGSVFSESDLMGGLIGENRLITISGKVNNPGIYEIPENATLKDILDIAGGMKNGKDFKAAQFGLPFGGFATKESLNEVVDFEHFFDSNHPKALIILSGESCIVQFAKYYIEFILGKLSKGEYREYLIAKFEIERSWRVLDRISKGKGNMRDLYLLRQLSQNIKESTGQKHNLIDEAIEAFYHEFEEHIEEHRCYTGECPQLVKFRITSKCIGCTACARVCPVHCIEGKIKERHRIDIERCTHCGQCVAACPVNAINEGDNSLKFLRDLGTPGKIVITQMAPAVRVALGEAFGFEAGTNIEKKINGALRMLGVDYVFDTAWAADLTIMEEATEFQQRLEAFFKGDDNVRLPILTSCCPAWVKFIEQSYPDMLDVPSTVKSPMQIFSTIAKDIWAKEKGYKRDQVTAVAIMPCLAKKYEAAREEFSRGDNYDTDYVITTRELIKILKETEIDLNKVEEEEFDNPLGEYSGAGIIFGRTGGVIEAATRSTIEMITGERIENIEFEALRGWDGFRSCDLTIGHIELRIGIAHGLEEAKKMLDKIRSGEEFYHAIEIMACKGGCIGGGGQPKAIKKQETLEKRAEGLNNIDKISELRRSHENPQVQAIYDKYLDYPLSRKAHELLHTKYFPKIKTHR